MGSRRDHENTVTIYIVSDKDQIRYEFEREMIIMSDEGCKMKRVRV